MRRVTVIALMTVAVGAGLTTQTTSPWQLYLLWGLAVGGATGAVAVPLAAIVANRWFSTRRGLVTGMLTASNASGQLVFLPLLAWVVTAYSWRAAAALIALTAILLVVPMALVFLRTDPADVGLMPYGAVEPEPPRRLVNPFRNAVHALRDAVRVRDFWLLAGAFFICGATTNGLIGTHLIAACSDHGLSEVRGAGLLAAIGVFEMIGPTVLRLADRPLRSALAAVLVLRLAGDLAAGAERGAARRGLGLAAFAVFYGLDWGRHGAADSRARPPGVRPRAGGRRVRLGVRVPPVRRGVRSVGAGATAPGCGSYQPAFLVAGTLGVIGRGAQPQASAAAACSCLIRHPLDAPDPP